jgi:spore coat protein U-like protein
MSINSNANERVLVIYMKFYNVIRQFYLKILFLIPFLVVFKNYQALGDCTLTTANIVFSAFNPYDATFERANGLAKVYCINTSGSSSTITYSLTLSAGGSGNQTDRLVVNGVKSVSYNLYKNSTYTEILGDGYSSTIIKNTYTLASNASRTDNYTIYGKIPVQPLAEPMTYTDTITATLNY